MGKKIAIIIQRLSGDGAERVVSNLSLGLSDFFKRYVVLYDKDNIAYPYGGELICIGSRSTGSLFGKFKALLIRLCSLRQIKKHYGIEAAISFLDGPNAINILTRSKEKVIVSVRNYKSKSLQGFYGMIYKLMIRLLYNKADLVVAVSKAVRNDLISNYSVRPEKIIVIYNPYNISQIQELSLHELEPEYRRIFDGPVIINVGRLSDQKGQWHLVRAFSKVKSVITNASLVFVGTGELRNYLGELVGEYGLQAAVHFLGFQSNPFSYVGRSSVFVLSSLFEGFPNALAEAMACGIPVISSDCRSGPRELLAPSSDPMEEASEIQFSEYGILVPVCDGRKRSSKEQLTREEELLAESIIKLCSSGDLYNRYCELSRNRISSFDFECIIPQYESIF